MTDTRRLAVETRTGRDAFLRTIVSRLRRRIRATRPPGAVAILSAALVLTALVLAVHSVLVSFATHGALPQGDEWFSLGVFRSMLTGEHVLADLFSQHNDHRIAFPRLILYSDYVFFKGRGDFDVAAIFLMQGALAVLLLTLLARTRTRAKGSVAVGAMVPLLLFSLRQSENFVWGFQVGFVSVFTLATLAIVTFAQALERSRRGRGSGVATSISYGLVAVATFSMSNGLLCGIVLIAMAVVARASRRHIVGITAITIALIAAFSFRYQFLGGPSLRDAWLQRPLEVAMYAAAYLGNFLDPDVDAAVFFGACGLLALGIVFARFAMGRDRDPVRLALLGIALFTAGSAVLTALGRFSDGIGGAMSSRYATGGALFWCAMLICGWSLSGSSTRPVALRLIMAGASLVLLTAIVDVQAPGVAVLQGRAFDRNMIENALDQGLIDEAMLTTMDESPEQIREIVPFLRRRGHLDLRRSGCPCVRPAFDRSRTGGLESVSRIVRFSRKRSGARRERRAREWNERPSPRRSDVGPRLSRGPARHRRGFRLDPLRRARVERLRDGRPGRATSSLRASRVGPIVRNRDQDGFGRPQTRAPVVAVMRQLSLGLDVVPVGPAPVATLQARGSDACGV